MGFERVRVREMSCHRSSRSLSGSHLSPHRGLSCTSPRLPPRGQRSPRPSDKSLAPPAPPPPPSYPRDRNTPPTTTTTTNTTKDFPRKPRRSQRRVTRRDLWGGGNSWKRQGKIEYPTEDPPTPEGKNYYFKRSTHRKHTRAPR